MQKENILLVQGESSIWVRLPEGEFEVFNKDNEWEDIYKSCTGENCEREYGYLRQAMLEKLVGARGDIVYEENKRHDYVVIFDIEDTDSDTTTSLSFIAVRNINDRPEIYTYEEGWRFTKLEENFDELFDSIPPKDTDS